MNAFMKLFGVFKDMPAERAPATVHKSDLLAALDEVVEEQITNMWNPRHDFDNKALEAMQQLINILEIPE